MATAKQAAEVIVNEVLSMSEEEAEAALLSALSVRHANEVIRG